MGRDRAGPWYERVRATCIIIAWVHATDATYTIPAARYCARGDTLVSGKTYRYTSSVSISERKVCPVYPMVRGLGITKTKYDGMHQQRSARSSHARFK
jgi:hypothetical protein